MGYLREASGETAYERYVEHRRREHPDDPVMSRRDFERWRMDSATRTRGPAAAEGWPAVAWKPLNIAQPKKLEGEKAQRIIEAMRASVGTRGAAGSTFDHVAGEAGVSRGLLHYYFGSKERLLVEVVRHDCEARIGAMEERIARADSVDEIVAALVVGLEEFIEGEPGSQAVIYEMLSASRHSEEIRAELAELYRRWRAHLADALRAKEREGIVRLRPTPSRWRRCSSRSPTASESRCSPIPTGIATRPSASA